MAAKFSQRFLAGIVLCLFAGNLFAFNTSELRGFDEKVFDYYFDRADREADPSSWMREARQGLALAIAGWETQALELYADPEFRAEAGQELIRWSEEELEKRYAQWLFKRFFGASSGQMSKMLDHALDKANRLYAYHTDDDGNIIYDETGAPQGVRPSEGRSVEADRELWTQMLNLAGEAELQYYKQTVTAHIPELLFYIDENNRSRFEEHLAEIFAKNILSRQAEFEAVLAREERLFVARRTGDIWSLRKQSENQSAALISSQLIREVENSCAAGIASLEERIEAAKAGTGDLALAGEEWLTAFQEQFDRGLKAWADAEERFIIRRMEWERDSGDRFLEGEEAWRAAFAELEKERFAWEEDAWKLFAAGEQLFIDVSEELNAAISGAREEFSKDAALRIYSGAGRTRALLDMYVTCVSVLGEAEASVNFWLSRFVSGVPENALAEGTLGIWVQEILDYDIRAQERQKQTIPADVPDQELLDWKLLSEEQKTAGRELIRWAALYTQYRTRAIESMATLESEFGLILGMDRDALNAVLDSSSEDFFLDEYQIELLRARTIAGYWEQRLAIAEAVSSYAEDISAGRMTEAESLLEWRSAKTRYDEALAAYQNFQEQLSAAGNDLAAIQIELREKADRLAAEERKLDELGKRHAMQMSLYQSETADSVLNKIASYYNDLMDISETRSQDDSYYAAYLRAELRYAEEYVLKDGWSLLESIVLSDTDPETKQIQLSLLGSVSSLDWYYAVSGKEETEADREALEAEGLIKRLKREAEEERNADEDRQAEKETEPGLAQKMLLVYQELIFYAPGLQAEAAEFAWQSLSGLFAEFGISVPNGALPDIVSLTERLLEYGEENDLSPGSVIASLLMRIDAETEMLPMMLGLELSAWREALIDYMAAGVLYRGIAVPEDAEEIFENYITLFTDICKRIERQEEVSGSDMEEAAFYQNLLEFLVLYNNYKAIIETSKNEKREHWRSYVNGAGDSDNGALSWEEGLLADALEPAAEADRRMAAAFGLFLESGISERQMDFIACVESFLANTEKAWEDMQEEDQFTGARETFRNELECLQNDAVLENSMKEQIAGLGFDHYVLFPPGVEILDVIESVSLEMEKAKVNHHLALEAYNSKADEYANRGGFYEKLYGEAKELFNSLGKARNEYEKQDAIQRWASTAYLQQSSVLSDDLQYYKEPAEELAYTRERNERAQIALAVLQDLYHDGETSRAFADSGYMALYEEYRESFSAMFLALKAKTEFSVNFEELQARNRELYAAFYYTAFEFLPVSEQLLQYFEDYSFESSQGDSWRDYIYVTESGELGISRDKSSFGLQQLSQDEAAELAEYFRKKNFSGDGTSQMSAFEAAFSSWAARMGTYSLFTAQNYQTWGFALDYIIAKFPEKDFDRGAAEEFFGPVDMATDGRIELDKVKLSDRLSSYYKSTIPRFRQEAWDSLDAQQKADLEFLAVMILAGGGGEWSEGLTIVSKYKELTKLYNKADEYKYTKRIFGVKVTFYHRPYWPDHSELWRGIDAIQSRLKPLKASFDSGSAASLLTFSKVEADVSAYNESCDELISLSGRREEGVEWPDIEQLLSSLGTIDKSEIARLEVYWKEMLAYNHDTGKTVLHTSIFSALDALYFWKKGIREALEQELQQAYLANEKDRIANQDQYRKTLDAYINGECGIDRLHEAARLAYGQETAAVKNHYSNLGTAMLDDLKTINADRGAYAQQYQLLADQYVSLVERAYSTRFGAELAVREIEWFEQRKDLNNKLASWQEAAGLILERGRQDWKNGYESLEAAYAKWQHDFLEHYTAIDAAWNAAYLDSLESKELWINEAVNAANDALNSNLLVMIGSDAEAGSRKLDGFMPSSFMDFGAVEEAAAILRTVLGSAGIVNLRSAVGSLTGSASTVMTQARSGVSGLGVWNSGQAQAAAKELAWNSTSELASGKMMILALQSREAVYEAKKLLEERVAQSNKGFDGSIDDLYLMTGGWARSGSQYIKDIVVHSTVFKSAITDKVTLDAYKWFVVECWDFSTDLSDANLQNKDYSGLQYFIGLAQNEVQKKSEALFGVGDQKGEFQDWIGTYSEEKEDQRSGELGRLAYEFNHWERKQAQGIALMNSAFWDKPLWDSRDSWFKAPSIRSTVDIVNSIAATIVGAVLSPFTAGGSFALALGINMTDDLLFGLLDATHGYVDWADAGVAFGKKALISVAASAGGALFNGVGTALAGGAKFAGITKIATDWAGSTFGTAGTVVAQTGMAGLQALTVGTVTSAISAITYEDGKFGWSKYAFGQGFRDAAISSAVAGTSSLTTGLMNFGLEGFYAQYYANGTKLSSLVGGLAGQGVNFAFGGDITLNAFNLGFMSDKLAGSGLLELHFGWDGFSANIGSGGVDVSYGTLVSAYKGLEAWKVNFDIWTSGSDSAKNYISGMRTLYSGDETNKELYQSILAGETRILENRDVDYTQTTYDPVIGKTIILGKNALDDESRFGLNVILSHESYRNGVDDGFEGQRQETNAAVVGHISTALGLMGTYGTGSIGAAMADEAKGFSKSYQALMSETASELEKMQAIAEIMTTLNGYDADADYWRLQYDGTLVSDGSGWLRDENGLYVNSDGSRTKGITNKTIGASGIKNGLLNIMFGGTKFTDFQKEAAEIIFICAGLTGDRLGQKGFKLDMGSVMSLAGDTVSKEVFKAYYNNTIDYNLANDYGVDLIFNTNGNWDPKVVYDNVRERYDQLIDEKYGHLLNEYSAKYTTETLKKSLQDKYLQTIQTDKGTSTTVLRITENNPYLSMVLGQRDPAFVNASSTYYDANLSAAGCNFMSTIAVPQLLTGNVFDAKQVTDIWNWAKDTRLNRTYSVMDPSGFVRDTNRLSNYVMQSVLGYQNYVLTVRWESLAKPSANANFVAVKEKYSPSHFVLNGTDQKLVFNPWPYLNGPNLRYDGVFLNVR